MITLKYIGRWAQENSRNFSDLKTCSQYIRRNKIPKYKLYAGGKQIVVIGSKTYTVESLKKVIEEAEKNLRSEK